MNDEEKVLYLILATGHLQIFGESVGSITQDIENAFRYGHLMVMVDARTSAGGHTPVAVRLDDILSVVEAVRTDALPEGSIVFPGSPAPGIN